MKFFFWSLAKAILFLGTALAVTSSLSAAQIVVGQVAPMSGPDAEQGRAYTAGMQLLFDTVNQAGGVNGNSFNLVTLDDAGSPQNTVRMTRQLIAESPPLVLAGYFGRRNIAALMEAGLLEKEKLVLLGYRATEINEPFPSFYSVRANLRDELEKIAVHLDTLGVTRVGLLYEYEPSVTPPATPLREWLGRGRVTIVARASYEAGTTRVTEAVDALLSAAPQAIILVTSGSAGARFIEQFRAGGGSSLLFVHSGADMERTSRQIAQDRLSFVSTVMRGVAIAQVVPNPREMALLSTEFRAAISKTGKPDIQADYVTMEGFIAAKVIVEAVRRQGARPTRAGMGSALDNLNNLNLGGYVIGFNKGNRSGSHFVHLSIISDTGKIRQ
ncbi:ABC transporter substrate-binding protein [Acidovorax sp. D2M1]|uniref:ABC transporter substrate-binding protein n=1 Tax=Acidovorax benzenivorans TaxID=2987520 RepID=A0ABT5RZV5_9BURK|nr:ABC transporter substrate-binding protein [Acidovorax benzenivorans]MDD2179238.1 ABC transporter substrate-binding protein [Acidovorax benzenivorans]